MEKKRKNPWQGLKSYSEGKVLYGRDKEIVELSQKILYNTQTIIYGRSGIGKSSLLKAGVFPVLRKHNLFPVYIRLSHSEKDDYSYANQVFDAVEKSLSELRVENLDSEAGYDIVSGYKEETVPVVNEHAEGLWEYFHRHRFFYKPVGEEEPVQITPVLVFDQFEELFTLQDDRAKMLSLFKELELLLNDVCPDELLQQGEQEGSAAEGSVKSGSLIKTAVSFKVRENRYLKGNNFHLVMSVREDFLSHLERNSTNIPSLKHNRYCLLPLSEDRAAEVIMKPVPGLVSLQVAKEIISKVTGVPATGFEIDDNPELEVDSAILSLFLSELYAKKGTGEPAITLGMVDKFGSNIISDFYQETMEHISKPSVEYLERRLVTKEGRRDAIYWEQALRHNVTQKELDFLLGQRLLHRYSWRDGIRVEFSHDILCPIISKRRKEREAEAERAKARRTKRILMLSLALSLLCVGGLVYWYIYSEKKYQKEYVDECVEIYSHIIKRNTWLEGINPITKEEASHLPYSYWFYKKGTKAKHPYRMEVRDGYGKYTTESSMSTYLVNHYDDTDKGADGEMKGKLSEIVRWEFLADNNNRYCIQENAYTISNELVFSYKNSIQDDGRTVISSYFDKNGFPLVLRDNKVLYIRTTLDDNGYEVLQEFFDVDGIPSYNKDSAFATRREYLSNGILVSQYSVFVNGEKMIDRFENCGIKTIEVTRDSLRALVNVSFDDKGFPCRPNNGSMVTKYVYDEYGRVIQECFYTIDKKNHKNGVGINAVRGLLKKGEIGLEKDVVDGCHKVCYEYNNYGKITSIKFFGINDEYVTNKYGWSSLERDYDSEGNMMSELVYNNMMLLNSYSAKYDETGKPYFIENYEINEDSDTIWRHKMFESNAKKEEFRYFLFGYNHIIYDENNNILCDSSYDAEGNLWVTTEYLYDDNLTRIKSWEAPNKTEHTVVDSLRLTKKSENSEGDITYFYYKDKQMKYPIGESFLEDGVFKKAVYISPKISEKRYGYCIYDINGKASYSAMLGGISVKFGNDFYNIEKELIPLCFYVISDVENSSKLSEGDILVKCGDYWRVDGSNDTMFMVPELSLLDKSTKYSVTVLRYDNVNCVYEVITDAVFINDLSFIYETVEPENAKKIFKIVEALE